MHFNTLGFVAATIAALSQTGAANIGQGTRLLGKIAGEVGTTGWNVGLHVSDKRDLDGLPKRAPQGANPFPGVADVEYERCFNDAVAAVITATSPAGDVIRFDGVPASCMNLANVLGGTGVYAVPCGSACLQYSGLTQGEYNEIASALQLVV